MFLSELNKTEGIAFIQLVKELAKVDDEFAKEEKQLYKEYLQELDIEETEVSESTLQEVCLSLKNSSNRIKNIIYFELVGLALIDGKYEEKEVEFLENIEKELSISRSKKIAFANYFYNFTNVYNFSVVESHSKIQLLKEQAEKLLN